MEAYAGQQFVGIDLHRRRSVIVPTTERGAPARAESGRGACRRRGPGLLKDLRWD